jgi:hypothetical protein
VSVLMPAYGQSGFLPRAVASLLAQTLGAWELIVVDDGSPDDTAEAVAPFLEDPRVRLRRREVNGGLGRALNDGLDAATAPLVAYLPCDDLLRPAHLATLVALLDARTACVAAVGGLEGPAEPMPQLVQVVHRRTADRWTERAELESDDLERLFWGRLRRHGAFLETGAVTCAWTRHPGQRHRAFRESCDGGLNAFRRRYRIPEPLRFHSTETGLVDEVARYDDDRRRPPTPPAPDGLRILLAGELAYNPDRVLALEERGHRLLGAWIDDPLGFNTVGPLPFGHVQDVAGTPREAVRRARPDVVYAQLNWRAAPLAHALLDAGAPVVWHFKEAPQRSLLRGEWPLLAELHARAAGVIYATPLERDWFEAVLPGRRAPADTLVLDGDLPRARRLDGALGPRPSDADGAPHLALIGRPAGFAPADVAALAALGLHVHLHGLAATPANRSWLAEVERAARGRVHVHPAVGPEDWVRVLSRYDGGLLHRFRSANGGDVRLATWDDLNQPARIPTLLAAGVPLLQRGNPGSAVHVEALVRRTDAGCVYRDDEELTAWLATPAGVAAARARALAVRHDFTFEAHVDRLVAFLRRAASSA